MLEEDRQCRNSSFLLSFSLLLSVSLSPSFSRKILGDARKSSRTMTGNNGSLAKLRVVRINETFQPHCGDGAKHERRGEKRGKMGKNRGANRSVRTWTRKSRQKWFYVNREKERKKNKRNTRDDLIILSGRKLLCKISF